MLYRSIAKALLTVNSVFHPIHFNYRIRIFKNKVMWRGWTISYCSRTLQIVYLQFYSWFSLLVPENAAAGQTMRSSSGFLTTGVDTHENHFF